MMKFSWRLVFLIAPTIALFPNLFNRSPEKIEETLSASYIPAAVQIIANILQQLEYHPSQMRAGPPPEIVITQLENSTIFLDIKDEVEDAHSVKSTVILTIRKLSHLLKTLNKEAQKQHMDSYQGLSSAILNELEKTTSMTAGAQLTVILKLIDKKDVSESTFEEINGIIIELQDRETDLYKDLSRLSPIPYRL